MALYPRGHIHMHMVTDTCVEFDHALWATRQTWLCAMVVDVEFGYEEWARAGNLVMHYTP